MPIISTAEDLSNLIELQIHSTLIHSTLATRLEQTSLTT